MTEWRLVCEKRYLTFLGPTVYYIGVLMGAWIAGLLADRIGRLPVQALCLYTQGTMAVALYVVQVHINFLEKKKKKDKITLIKILINEIYFFFFFIKIFNSRIDLRFNSSHSFNEENKRRLRVEYQINRE